MHFINHYQNCIKTQTINNIFIVLVIIYKNNKVYFNNIMYDYLLNQNLIQVIF